MVDVCLRYAGKPLDKVVEASVGIDEGLVGFENSRALEPHGAYLDNLVVLEREPRGLKVQGHPYIFQDRRVLWREIHWQSAISVSDFIVKE